MWQVEDLQSLKICAFKRPFSNGNKKTLIGGFGIVNEGMLERTDIFDVEGLQQNMNSSEWRITPFINGG